MVRALEASSCSVQMTVLLGGSGRSLRTSLPGTLPSPPSCEHRSGEAVS